MKSQPSDLSFYFLFLTGHRSARKY